MENASQKKKSILKYLSDSRITQIAIDPFKVISENISEFLIWFLFTIITGQFGIIANVIVKCYANNTSITYSIYVDSINGSFYTFSIALVASVLGPIFINFLNSEKLKFRTLKTFTIILSIFYLFFAGIIYASIQSKSLELPKNANFSIDFTQLLLYLLSIFLVSYAYCILKLENSKKNFTHINDPIFNEKDDQKVKETIDAGREINEDPNGIEL